MWGHLCSSDTFHFHRPIPKWQLNPWWPPTALRTPSDIAGQSGRTGLRRTFGGTSPLWLRLCQCPLVKHRTMIEFRVKAELGKLYRLTFPWWGEEVGGWRSEVGGQQLPPLGICIPNWPHYWFMGFIFRRFVCRKRIEWHKSVGQTIMKMLAHIATLMYPHPHPYLYLYLHLVLLLIVVFYTNILCDIVYWYSFQKLIKQKCFQLSCRKSVVSFQEFATL